MIEAVLRRDRAIAVSALVIVSTGAWWWTLTGAGMPMPMPAGAPVHDMQLPSDMAMPGMSMAMGTAAAAVTTPAGWSSAHALLIFAMWWVMMIAMMLPAAAPFVLLAARIRDGPANGTARAAAAHGTHTTALVATGYLAVWGAFSVLATLAQWALHAAGALSAHALAVAPAAGGAIFIAAGLYQLTPVKRACLTQCRSPARFLVEHWRPGATGAVRLGVRHGAFCVGCCWALMALLFAGGIMNAFWIGAVALYILVEKLGPHGVLLSRISAAVLIVGGVLLLLGAL
jgi:predicted metal-binding membrane protein